MADDLPTRYPLNHDVGQHNIELAVNSRHLESCGVQPHLAGANF